MHTFTNGVTLVTAGSQSVTATDKANSSIHGSAATTISPAAAVSLNVSGFPSPVNADTYATFTVTARDHYGNTATGYGGTVTFSSSDRAAVLPGNATLSKGTGSFTAAMETVGTQSLTATDTVTKSITGIQSGIQVTGVLPVVTGVAPTMGVPRAGSRPPSTGRI